MKTLSKKTMGPLFILYLLCLSPLDLSAQLAVEKYIQKYNTLAINMMNEYSIPASIILSVAIVESAACTSRNCLMLKNHFGIKSAKRTKIPGTRLFTAYKKYDTDTASYRHFCEWIMKKKFYQEICGKLNYEEWINAIGHSGYTMSPSHWKKKVSMIQQKHKLERYDGVADPLLKLK